MDYQETILRLGKGYIFSKYGRRAGYKLFTKITIINKVRIQHLCHF